MCLVFKLPHVAHSSRTSPQRGESSLAGPPSLLPLWINQEVAYFFK